MKKYSVLLFAATITMSQAFSQSEKSMKSKFGVKAGYNFSYVTGSKQSFSPAHNNGYMVSVFMSQGNKNGMGYQGEFVYSKQGYSFENGGKNTDVMNDYLYMPHLMTLTIAKALQLQARG